MNSALKMNLSVLARMRLSGSFFRILYLAHDRLCGLGVGVGLGQTERHETAVCT